MKSRPIVWHVGGEDVHMRIPLLKALAKRGFSVGAVGSEGGEPFKQAGIPYWYYTLNRWISPLADRLSVAKLTRLFCEFRPDIVHGFDTKPAMLAMHAAKAAGIPGRVRTITGMGYVFSSRSPLTIILRPVYRQLQRRASKSSSMTVFQNSDDREYFLRNRMVDPQKSELILSSGIDVREFCATVPSNTHLQLLRNDLGLNGRTVVTMVARLVRNKGVQEYLDAARRIAATHSNVAFLLVGPVVSEGRQAVALKQIQKYSSVVKYLGKRNDISALLALSDIVILPSYYREGIPRVLLEASALGKPIVTTDMPGCKEVVHHGKNGLLVPPRDSSALAKAIRKLLDDQNMRLSMGQKSAVLVKRKFDLAIVANAYAAIYWKVLDK